MVGWKLYIDSRKRVKGSNSDFTISLPYPISVTGKAYIDVCLLTNGFYTIRANENDRIFLDENSTNTKRVAVIEEGQYSIYELRDQLVIALNSNKLITGQYRVTYSTATNKFTIDIVNPAISDSFRIWTEDYLKLNFTSWFTAFPYLDATDMKSANYACGFSEGTTLNGTNLVIATALNAPDVQPYKQLFLRSNLGGGSAESLGLNGETDIIRRIVVGNTPLNAMIHDTLSNAFDCVTINGHPEFSQLWFQLVDINGSIVNTRGHPISFSILFQNMYE